MSTFKLNPITGELDLIFVPSTTSVFNVDVRYINFLDGHDLSGDGSINFPWKTLQHAYNSVTDVSINRPYVFYLSGGNNDVELGPITAKPNVSLISDYQIQISQPFTITGGTTNDGATFTNITFIGAFTWIRNDFSLIGTTFINCQFFSGPNLKQQGGGSFGVSAINCVFVNMDLLVPRTGSFFISCTFLGNTTFEDADFNAFYELLGGYTSSAMSIAGGAEAYFSGLQVDVPFGASLTAVTTGNGSPLFQTDASSVPPTITGTPSLNFTSQSLYTAYTPADSSKWQNPQPTTVKQALDRIAAVVGATTPIP